MGVINLLGGGVSGLYKEFPNLPSCLDKSTCMSSVHTLEVQQAKTLIGWWVGYVCEFHPFFEGFIIIQDF